MKPIHPIVALSIFLGLGIIMGILAHDAPGLCNDTSRLATADALINHHTLHIDQSVFRYTCDRIKVGDHFFSDKPPVLSLGYTVGLWFLQTTLGLSLPENMPFIYQLLTFFFAGIPFCWIVFLLCRQATHKQWPLAFALPMALILPLCSQTFVFATTLNSHIVAAALLLWFWFRREHRKPVLGSGLILGLALTIDPLSIAFILSWLLIDRKKIFTKRFLPKALLGFCIPVALHCIFCWLIAGHPFALNLNPEHFVFEGATHSTETLTGVGIKHASLSALLTYGYNSLLGHHGFFIYNALCLLGLFGFFLKQDRDKKIIFCTLGLFFGLTILFSNNHSGDAFGNRWHVLLVPLCLYGLASLDFEILKSRPLILPFVLIFCVWGGFLSSVGYANPWTPHLTQEHPFVVQNSTKPPHANYELLKAQVFLKMGHFNEARAQGELALRRRPLDPEAWSIVVTSAIYRQDFTRLKKYRKNTKNLELPSPFKEDILTAMEAALLAP